MSKTARQAEPPPRCPECGGRGWHKLSCSQRTDRAPQYPATRDAGGVVTVCQRSHVVDADKMVGPCRGGQEENENE